MCLILVVILSWELAIVCLCHHTLFMCESFNSTVMVLTLLNIILFEGLDLNS